MPYSLFASGAASLSLSPATGTYSIGDTFTVSVNVDTGGEPINAVEGKISFNTDELEAAEISKDGSVLESWTIYPTSSNEDGTISFAGGMKNFKGSSGKIFSITFRALKTKESQVRFSTGAAILAADGLGTNILTVMNAGAYSLVPKEIIPAVEPPSNENGLVLGVSSSTEQKILIASASHPNEDAWHNQEVARFSWTLPPEVTAVRLSVNASSSSVPANLYPPIREKTVSDISEGVSYFHFQAKTEFGWGEPIAYRFQTDTKNPEIFRITEASTTANISDSFGFLFEARDKTSGIEKYLVQIDNGAKTEWRDDGSHTYIPEPRSPGNHTLFAKAFDFAGNFATSSVSFTLVPIDPPAITSFQEKIFPGDALIVRGTAEPNTAVSVWISKDGARAEENKITSDVDGMFTFVLNGKAQEGTYKIYADELGRGVRSAPSESILIAVSQPGFILLGKTALDYLSILIPLTTLVLLLIFILVFGWHRFMIFRMTLQKEVEEAGAVSRKSFSRLRREIYEDERILASIGSPEEKIKKEKEVVKRLKKSVDAAEEKVEKEISDVKKKVTPAVRVKAKKV
jgi:hypothetical protein